MPKLSLTLLKRPITAEGVALLVERVTGRKPSPAKMREIRARLEARAKRRVS
jgi:hypothetical protein